MAPNGEKRKIFHFFKQKNGENIFFTEKSCTFASHLSIGLWCNGNTADSGPAFPGSSPGSPTERKEFFNRRVPFSFAFFFVYSFLFPNTATIPMVMRQFISTHGLSTPSVVISISTPTGPSYQGAIRGRCSMYQERISASATASPPCWSTRAKLSPLTLPPQRNVTAPISRLIP